MNLYGSIAPSDRTSASVLLNEKVILDSFHFAKCRRLVANKKRVHSKLQRQNVTRNVLLKRKIYACSTLLPTVRVVNSEFFRTDFTLLYYKLHSNKNKYI